MAVNGKKIFGAGRFFGINNVTNPTPARFGVPQDISVSFKRAVKSLFGENQLAADVASGELTVSGKVTLGTVNPRIYTDLVFGDAGSTGQIIEADKESGTLTSFAYTVANATNFVTDCGVVNATTGVPYACVASGSEVAGKSYSLGTGATKGKYTFASAETGTNFKFSYLYNSTTTGETVTLANQPMGKTGNFTAVNIFPWGSEQDVLVLNSCMGSDAELSTKAGDYGKPTFAYEASSDVNDILGTFTFAEAA